MNTTIWFEVLAFALLCVLALPHYMWCNKMADMARGKWKLNRSNLRNWKKYHAYLALAVAEVTYLLFGGFEISIVLKVLFAMQIVAWVLQIPSSYFLYKKLKEQDRLDVGDFEVFFPKNFTENILNNIRVGSHKTV